MDRTLLYIDPDPATRLLVRKVLASEGFLVLEAKTAVEGQRSAARIRPDLILVDVDLVKAAELVPALRQSPGLEEVRLLASTADAWPEHMQKMLALGFDRVLLEPLDIDALALELSSCLPPAPPAEGLMEEAPHEEARHEEAAHEEAAHATTGEAPVDTEAPVLALEPVEVPPLWRLSLTPVTANLVRSVAAAEGLLALFDDEKRALVIVAAASGRHAGNGTPADVGAPIGTRVLASTAPWLHPAIRNREAAVVATGDIDPSPLALPGSSTLVIVPVASHDHVYGVVILGKHRGSKVPSFSAGKMARSVAAARHIAGLVETLRKLDRAAAEKRRELEHVRLETVRTLLPEMTAGAKRSRRHGAGRERTHSGDGREGADRDRIIGLGVTLGERLGLSARQRETLRQALEVWDIGRAWVEDVLLAGARLSVAGRARLLDTHAEHGAEILSALDWPPAVVELVRVHQVRWNGEGQPAGPSGADIPMEARVLAVVSAFARLTAGRADGEGAVREALVELSHQAGNRLDPDVVEALIGLGLSSEDPHSLYV